MVRVLGEEKVAPRELREIYLVYIYLLKENELYVSSASGGNIRALMLQGCISVADWGVMTVGGCKWRRQCQRHGNNIA